jgi:hypothetical protein
MEWDVQTIPHGVCLHHLSALPLRGRQALCDLVDLSHAPRSDPSGAAAPDQACSAWVARHEVR